MVDNNKIDALLRLFKGYEIEETYSQIDADSKQKLIELGLQNGIVFENVTYDIPAQVIQKCIDMYGIKSEEWNNTFHKSFQTVLDTPINILVAQQLVHYFTVYGLESLNMYDKDLVYIPAEKLEIPNFDGSVKLAIIHSLTKQEIKEKLLELLSSGIALSAQTIADIISLIDYIDVENVDIIKNREIKNILYEKYNIVPTNNIEFLRFLIYKTTGSTLLIKNSTLIFKIKMCDKKQAFNLIQQYINKCDGYINLAKIFLRYKDIFLAYKIHNDDYKYLKYRNDMNKIINKIRKLSNKYHESLEKNILDKLTLFQDYSEYIAQKDNILENLEKITVFKEIRIINGLRYRYKVETDNVEMKKRSIVYKIRNNKVYATKLKNSLTNDQMKIYKDLIILIEKHLISRLQDKFENKTFYIPSEIKYVLPTSEKQFIGNLPVGTQIKLPRYKNTVIGVFWTNLDTERVDLDLKAINEYEEIGWNSDYYSSRKNVIFSGDITDAPKPKGATESIFISSDVENSVYTLKLNNYTKNHKTVPFEFFVSGTSDNIDTAETCISIRNYTVNPNDVILSIKNAFYNDIESEYINSSLTLGQVSIEDSCIIINLIDYEDVSKAVSSLDTINWHIHNYNKQYRDVQLSLDDIISKCGGKVVSTKEVEKYVKIDIDDEGNDIYKKVLESVDYDLSIESLEKDTIIKLLI